MVQQRRSAVNERERSPPVLLTQRSPLLVFGANGELTKGYIGVGEVGAGTGVWSSSLVGGLCPF